MYIIFRRAFDVANMWIQQVMHWLTSTAPDYHFRVDCCLCGRKYNWIIVFFLQATTNNTDISV